VQPIITTSGDLAPEIKHVMFCSYVVAPNFHQDQFKSDPLLAQSKLVETYYNCLKLADETSDFPILTLPAIAASFFGLKHCSLSHAVTCAVKRFVSDTARLPGQLRCIILVNLTLTLADIMSVVFEKCPVTVTAPPDVSNAEVAPPQVDIQPADTTKATDEWLAVESCLLKHKSQKGLDFYIVKWQDNDSPT